MNVPRHVAIIMDGNGRWAKSKGMPRNYGHSKGSKALEDLCEYAYDLNIEYLTVYAFSTENWTRPTDEVAALMRLLRNYMKTAIKRAQKNNMKVQVIGDKAGLDEDLQQSIARLEEATQGNTGLKFTIALNYGSRDEILRAVRQMMQDQQQGKLSPEALTEEVFSSYLDTRDLPDPDMVIRTSGEQRMSNFLMWQAAYAEFYFPDFFFPDFNKAQLEKAIEVFDSRDRRYGGVKEE